MTDVVLVVHVVLRIFGISFDSDKAILRWGWEEGGEKTMNGCVREADGPGHERVPLDLFTSRCLQLTFHKY